MEEKDQGSPFISFKKDQDHGEKTMKANGKKITVNWSNIRSNSSAMVHFKSHIYHTYSKLFQIGVNVDELQINARTLPAILVIIKHLNDFKPEDQEIIKARILSFINLSHGHPKTKYQSFDEIKEALRSLDKIKEVK